MLQRVEFKNYRCLRDTALQFEPLTVLVGPNASGKSTALGAIQFLAGNRSFLPTDPSDHDAGSTVALKFVTGDEAKAKVETVFTLSGGRLIHNLHGAVKTVQSLHLNLQALRDANVLAEGIAMDPRGGNLTNVFSTLDRSRQLEAVRTFCSLVPVFSDIHAKPISQGKHQLRFRDAFKGEVWYSPDEVSDGTMLVLAFLLTQFQTPQVDILAIEEPERGLHPYLLGSLMKFLRGMAHGEVGGKSVQIVLATHSASLLDHARPEEVRFFQRAADGSVTIESAPTGDATWSEYYSNYQESLGQAWLSGGLGGVPGG
jgi:predicted ATPase